LTAARVTRTSPSRSWSWCRRAIPDRLVEQRLCPVVGETGPLRPRLGAQRHDQGLVITRLASLGDNTGRDRPERFWISNHAPICCGRLYQAI
jgi:hypothetical protein